MRANRMQRYADFIEAFGIISGLKVILMRWLSHFTKKKVPYRIRWWGGIAHLRANTCDAELARSLIRRRGGEYDFLKRIKRIESFATIIDVGANIGLFSMLARKSAPNAQIIAVEPDSDNCESYRKNMGFRQGDELIEGGLWNKSCRLGLKSRPTGEVGFTVYEDENGSIKTVCMKEILHDNSLEHVDLCKIDIEGSEYEVFDESADEWIGKVGMFIVELHDRIKPGCSKRVNEMMKRHGFLHERMGENEVYYRKNLQMK